MFTLKEAIEILERTPNVLEQLLSGLSENWLYKNEGGESWSPFDIVGHLIHGEENDWINRTKHILEEKPGPFVPFNRFAHLEKSKGKTISQLLEEFKSLRSKSLETLRGLNLTEDDLNKKGEHPAFNEVTLKQLLSTWVVHDLGHIRQAVRAMAKQYMYDVGPWAEYLPVLRE